jgi:ubiquinone/menaquinone biosynthesis C-methylase UbiE/N-acetylglutamate synthase-like GNAT family acetyltransferase
MNGDMRIREATDRDIPLVTALLKKNDLPFEDIPSKIDSILIAGLNSETIGIGGVEVHGEYGLLRSLAVAKPFQGKGYGKALCEKLIQHAKNKGVKEVYLLTTTAASFFKQMGFEETKRSSAPTVVQNTTEFRELCPSSCTCMRKTVSGTDRAPQHTKMERKTTCSCCAPSPRRESGTKPVGTDIRSEVRKAYAERAKDANQSECCGVNAVTGQAGYSEEELKSLPETAKNVAAGCGNPTTLADLRKGETVLDLGSGGGIDVLLAARKVGPTGKVIGVDMTPEMIDTARQNACKSGVKNVEFRLGEIEHLPVADESVDVIISNCVINLSPDKGQVFREAHRVLRRGGRMLVSDMMTSGLPEEVKKNVSLWAECVGGAIELDEYMHGIKAAGFEVELVKEEDYSKEFIKDALENAMITSEDREQKTALSKLIEMYDKSAVQVSHAEIRATKT